MVIEVPQNDIQKMLNSMYRQSQRQHKEGIKAIIKTDDDKKKDKNKKKKEEKKPKCLCPKNITKTKKKSNTVVFRRKHYNGYQVKCPLHS